MNEIKVKSYKGLRQIRAFMPSKAIIIMVIVVVLAGLLSTVFLFGDSGANEFSIKSNDQLAELVIPRDVLPNDVDVNDISITRIPNNQFDDESLIVYELEPDGLVFKDEILFKVSLDGSDNVAPMVFISTSTGIDLVNNTKTEIDLETKRQNVTVPLTHFSKIAIKPDHGVYNLVVSALDTPVGKRVLTNAKFTLYKDNFLIPTSGDLKILVVEFLTPYVSLRGCWSNQGTNLTPVGEFGDKPSSTDVYVGQTVTVDDDTFTCIKPGVAYLRYDINVIVSEKITIYESEEDYLAGNATGSFNKLGSSFSSSLRVSINGIEASEEETTTEPQEETTTEPEEETTTEPEEETTTQPMIEPEVELSFKWIEDEDLLVTNKEIYVDIKAQPGANGTVTLTGPSIQPIEKTVTIDESGRARVKFDVIHYGKYTAVVQIGEFVVEKSIWA